MTDVLRAPAPWTLEGVGYLLAIRLPGAFLDARSFIPDTLASSRKGSLAYVMFVDYAQSNAGPYRELLYIPGSFQFRDARRLSITRIYVSTRDSVVNGRENWGIPKERCDFTVTYGSDGVDTIVLTAEDGNAFAALEFSERGFRLPVTTRIIPRSLRTLSQHWNGRQFTYVPEARGHIRSASLVSARIDPAYFPDIAQGRVIACVKVTDFELAFPVAEVATI